MNRQLRRLGRPPVAPTTSAQSVAALKLAYTSVMRICCKSDEAYSDKAEVEKLNTTGPKPCVLKKGLVALGAVVNVEPVAKAVRTSKSSFMCGKKFVYYQFVRTLNYRFKKQKSSTDEGLP